MSAPVDRFALARADADALVVLRTYPAERLAREAVAQALALGNRHPYVLARRDTDRDGWVRA